MGKRINVNLHLESNKGLLEEAVLNYYQQLQQTRGKNKEYLSAALLGYWEVIAYWDNGLITNEEVRLIKLEHNLHRLRQQINYLQDRFNLNYDSSSARQLLKLDHSSVETSNELVVFEYRYQVGEDTPEGQVARWLSQCKSVNGVVEKVMWASVAYWGAVACSELNWLELEQLQKCALNCIYRLEEQMDYLNNVLCPSRKVIEQVAVSPSETFTESSHESSSSISSSVEANTEDDIDESYFLDPEIWGESDEIFAKGLGDL